MATPQLYIRVKRSKKTGRIYWTMHGANFEKMSTGEGYDNVSFVRRLMKRFEAMGFIIEWDA